MTAINPARLKVQITELGELIDQPAPFIAQLHELLSFYSARVRQTSLAKTSLSLQTYQVPEPVIQALVNEIAERLAENLQAGYALADALWKENWMEFRQLAIHVLGLLPDTEPDRILHRVQVWLDDCISETIRRSIMIEGMAGLAKQKPKECLNFIQELINSESKENLQAAIFGLELFAIDPSYTNLPHVFNDLSKILLVEDIGLAKELSALIRILASRSEQETTYFLIKQLHPDNEPRTLRIIRQVLNDLSQDNQDLLRQKMEMYRN